MSPATPAQPGARARIKIGFVLLSPADRPIPSTRVAVLNMLPRLADLGFEPHLLFQPAAPTETPDIPLSAADIAAAGFRIVVFQKVRGAAVRRLIGELAALGVASVYLVCDVVEPELAALADATVVVTAYLRSLYPAPLQHKVHVVHDGIERPEQQVSAYRPDAGSANRPLRAVLVTSARMTSLPVIGSPPPWLQVRIVGRFPAQASALQRLREAQWQIRHAGNLSASWRTLRFTLDRRIRCVPWTPDGVYRELAAADIGILPIDRPAADRPGEVPDWKVKSENRLTLKMALGLPVVATSIPAYEPVLRHGIDGFFAETPADWMTTLQRLRDPALRRDIGQAARPAVLERFSQARQAELLATLFERLLAQRHEARSTTATE